MLIKSTGEVVDYANAIDLACEMSSRDSEEELLLVLFVSAIFELKTEKVKTDFRTIRDAQNTFGRLSERLTMVSL